MAEIWVTRVGAGDAGESMASEAAPWLERFARLGYAAIGVVYVLIGVLAVRAAIGSGGATTDTRGALRSIADGPAGRGLVLVIGVGLIGYALWQLLAAAKDAEGEGSDAKGIAKRLGRAGRAIIAGALGTEALRLALTAASAGGDQTRHWTARLLAAPYGRWVVIAAGAGVILYALYQFYRAAGDEVDEKLDLTSLSRRGAIWIARFGRFGIAARGIVFALVGWFLVQAALNYDPQRAGGIGQSLATLMRQPHGQLVLGIVAVGLIAFGLFQFANARYRSIRAERAVAG